MVAIAGLLRVDEAQHCHARGTSRSPEQRPSAPDRGDDVEDRLTGGGGGVFVHDQIVVGSAVDHAVRAVGRQAGQVVLRRFPWGITPAAGCQDNQWLVAEVTERCSLICRGRPLHVLVARALNMASGHGAGACLVPSPRRQAAVLELPGQAPTPNLAEDESSAETRAMMS
jgi:hypothetical protein